MAKSEGPTESISDLYRSLDGAGLREQLKMAEALADRPLQLDRAFGEEAREFKGFRASSEPFYPSGSRKGLPGQPKRIRETRDLARLLWQPPHWHVFEDGKPRKDLDFTYVDREIVTGRTTKGRGKRPATFSMDLLLANAEDKTPIAGELKIRSDQNAFYAMVQGLVHAARLATPEQLKRLQRFYADEFAGEAPERVDVYVVLHEPNPKGTQPKLLAQAEDLARSVLTGRTQISRRVRRIVCLETRAPSAGGALAFDLRFAASAG